MGETKLTAAGLARSMTLFDIDEDLDLLIHGAEEEAEANNGEVPEQLKTAIMEYFEAHLRKVDRIAGYVRAQDAEAQIAAREIERLQARQKAAKNRADRTKAMLCYFMASRGTQRLKGELNTISLQDNSSPSLVVTDIGKVPECYYNVQVEVTLPEWKQVIAQLPPGPLSSRFTPGQGHGIRVELDQGRLRTHLICGSQVDGATLAKGQHIRLR
jgi:hypothetical protein